MTDSMRKRAVFDTNVFIAADSDFEFLVGQYRGIKIMEGLYFLYEVRGDVKPRG